MFLVDAGVLLDVSADDPVWRPWSERTLEDALAEGRVSINPIIYAEVAFDFTDSGTLDRWLQDLEIERLELPYAAGFPASRAYARYRRAGGARRAPLPDFYIGAHAAVDGLTLISRDAGRYRTYFPSVRLLEPPAEI
ncbi:MAG: DNA-binding protein [Acidobacteriota bacterium]|nr:DNA-binding protein [Acidobacteriota bacterium]